MSARRGWCPGVFDPMPTGDGLLVRVKPPLGMVSAEGALALAEAALRFGNGTIEITRRGNLQVRGLSADGAAPFAAAMIGCGLALADAGAERRRCVMVSPLIGDDPTLAPSAAALAEAIERGLNREPGFAALPAKFCIAVDGGGVLPLRDVGADIAVRARDGGFAVSVEGEAAEIALHVRGFITQRVMPRLGTGIPGVGVARGGVDGRTKSGRGDAPPIGFIGYDASRRGAFAIGIPFGTMQAPILRALGALAVRDGDGRLRTTPWRTMVIGGVAERDAAQVADSAAALGLIVAPDDRRLRIVTCPGSPACSSATVPARADGATIAQLLAGAGTIHVSGCRKGCAHPGPAVITLVGDGGCYGIVRNGRASDASATIGLTIGEAVARLRSELAG
ncbi:MAG: nitrite reductase [Alphaproteobacteria bacterium]|nr:nitrite reductase [Alphaproteobacteria bacterium]